MTINCNWAHYSPLDCDGIITGCTQDQEWLLPWWWMNLRIHETHPVTFVNFGDMSKEALEWCQERGMVATLDVPHNFVTSREHIDPKLVSLWESTHPEVWKMRPAWFKKPFALLQSPYKRSLWLDLDCQVRGPLQHLFDICTHNEIAMKVEEEFFHELDLARGLIFSNEKIYNSGVIAFKHKASAISRWARESLDHNQYFMGDQQLFGRILFNQKLPVMPLSDIYNWRLDLGVNPNAIIFHWIGHYKDQILKEIEIYNQQFFLNLAIPKR